MRGHVNISKHVDGSLEVYGWNVTDPSKREVYLECEPHDDNLEIANDFIHTKSPQVGQRIAVKPFIM